MTHFLTLGFFYVDIFVYLLQYEHISSNNNFKLNDLTLHYSYTMANVKTVKKYIVTPMNYFFLLLNTSQKMIV